MVSGLSFAPERVEYQTKSIRWLLRLQLLQCIYNGPVSFCIRLIESEHARLADNQPVRASQLALELFSMTSLSVACSRLKLASICLRHLFSFSSSFRRLISDAYHHIFSSSCSRWHRIYPIPGRPPSPSYRPLLPSKYG